jgi:hypothetical protein
MAPAVPDRRVDAAVPGPRRVAIISGPTGGQAAMSPLRYPAKAKAPRSLIAVSIRLVQRYARARRRTTELQFKSHFKGEAELFFLEFGAYSSLQTSRPHPGRTKKWGHVKEGPCKRDAVTPDGTDESGKVSPLEGTKLGRRFVQITKYPRGRAEHFL